MKRTLLASEPEKLHCPFDSAQEVVEAKIIRWDPQDNHSGKLSIAEGTLIHPLHCNASTQISIHLDQKAMCTFRGRKVRHDITHTESWGSSWWWWVFWEVVVVKKKETMVAHTKEAPIGESQALTGVTAWTLGGLDRQCLKLEWRVLG
ncbi:hypothetical protein FB451DRAFT_1171464 [Mycena latifolia]|nr:hypothetical protein FB451DRAFT_1171464 [Mycena latifolia]